MTHDAKDIKKLSRDLARELRQAANCVEKGNMEQAKHHKDIACQDWQYLEIEAASSVSGIDEETEVDLLAKMTHENYINS